MKILLLLILLANLAVAQMVFIKVGGTKKQLLITTVIGMMGGSILLSFLS